jgi:hypothetical protein
MLAAGTGDMLASILHEKVCKHVDAVDFAADKRVHSWDTVHRDTGPYRSFSSSYRISYVVMSTLKNRRGREKKEKHAPQSAGATPPTSSHRPQSFVLHPSTAPTTRGPHRTAQISYRPRSASLQPRASPTHHAARGLVRRKRNFGPGERGGQRSWGHRGLRKIRGP